ncbi:MAG: helix-hairpin-helix domain-containing protein [Thermodesulfobacteriota bacterium]
MGSPGSGESSGRRQRSYLFLSMMLLVWNALATGIETLQSPRSGIALRTGSITDRERPVSSASTLQTTASPRNGPLSITQKYLIGKPIDINKSSKEEISALPGISDAIAEAIVAERERVGRFRSPEELLRVKGIKEKRLKKILPFLAKMENN